MHADVLKAIFNTYMERLGNGEISKDEILEMFAIIGVEVGNLGDQFDKAFDQFETGVKSMQGEIDRISFEKALDAQRFSYFLEDRNLKNEFQQFIENNGTKGG
jgi:hypothetical protein